MDSEAVEEGKENREEVQEDSEGPEELYDQPQTGDSDFVDDRPIPQEKHLHSQAPKHVKKWLYNAFL